VASAGDDKGRVRDVGFVTQGVDGVPHFPVARVSREGVGTFLTRCSLNGV
jgi:hypothetical protein